MKIQNLRVTCRDCGTVQECEVVTEAPVEVAVASMMVARCRECGSGKLGIGGAYRDAPPAHSPVERRAQWWIERGAVGTSSHTIWAVMTEGPSPRGGPDIPHDPDDFSRCHALLGLIPEWRERLGEVAERFPAWGPFVTAWDELTELFERGPDDKRKKLYTAMYARMRDLAA